MRCPACGRPADTLDARAVMSSTIEQTGPGGTTVTTESQLLVQCPTPPDGCGSRRLVRRTVTVTDQGETRRGRIAR